MRVSGKNVWRWLEHHNLRHRNYLPLLGIPLTAMLINHLFAFIETSMFDVLMLDFMTGVVFGWLMLAGYELIRPRYQKWKGSRGTKA